MFQKISFISPLFNHLEETQAMLASLINTIPKNLAYEIILIDDFSTDGTRHWLSNLELAHTTIILNEKNLGYAKNNNIAVKRATGDIIILLNNDLLLNANWLEPMLAALNNPLLNVGIVGNIQTTIGSETVDHAGIGVTAKAKIEHLKIPPCSFLSNHHLTPVFAVTAACIGIHREDFLSVGGFDESYHNGGEDVDLCLKIRQLGKNIYLAKNSIVQHHISLSRGRLNVQNECNSRLLLRKWRKEIKKEVIDSWRFILLAKKDVPIDGNLTVDAINTPNTMALILAESSIQQEEYYFSRLFDGINNSLDLMKYQYSFYKNGLVELRVSNIKSARNIYICGRTLLESTEINISINEIQVKQYALDSCKNFNIGIINPIIIPNFENRFIFSFKMKSSIEFPVVITHFILDNREIFYDRYLMKN